MSWFDRLNSGSERQRTSHRSLLPRVWRWSGSGVVDAVVVPTNRPVSSLVFAVELARELDCPILVLCSGESRAAAMEARFAPMNGAAVTVSSTPRHPMLALRTQRLLSSAAGPYLDTSNKRNVALLIGRMLGWQRVLFLDDDIQGLTAQQVRRAASVVNRDGVRMVGWRPVNYPDNSVACHALRSSGRRQDVFIGAGALLVELTGDLPHFPPIYNEDWLFWHDQVVGRRIKRLGRVRQTRYDPYADPQRARREEFGDVLAEGLYELVHRRRSVLVGCLPGYWDDVIQRRTEMLDGIEARLWRRRQRCLRLRRPLLTRDGHQISKVLSSVAAARAALELVTGEGLAEFVAAWRYDHFNWNARLHQLEPFDQIADALAWLGITDVHLGALEPARGPAP
jgi:hypothetical protein